MRRSLSLKADLVRAATVWVAVAVAALLAMWWLLLHDQASWAYRQDLVDATDWVQRSLRVDETGQALVAGLSHKRELMFQVLAEDEIYQIVGAKGEVLLASNGDPTPLLPGAPQVPTGQVVALQRHGIALRAMATPVAGAGPARFIVVARSQRFAEMVLENGAVHSLQSSLIATLLAMGIFATVVLVTMNRLLRRLRAASAAATLIAPANLTARLAVEGMPKEIVPLIESFNAALARLEAGFRNQQEFLALAAHELKTPIALLRAQVEMDGARDPARMLADLDHMGRHVHQLLHLAEVSDVASMAPEMTDVSAVAEDAMRALGRMATQQAVQVQLDDGHAPSLVRADAGGLFILIRNLLENALYHAPAGSTVRLVVSDQQLSVRDQGPGIAPADLPLIFQRFWRGAHRLDDGAGLGLAICQEIARAHGWQITAGNRPQGGAIFVVTFAGEPSLDDLDVERGITVARAEEP